MERLGNPFSRFCDREYYPRHYRRFTEQASELPEKKLLAKRDLFRYKHLDAEAFLNSSLSFGTTLGSLAYVFTHLPPETWPIAWPATFLGGFGVTMWCGSHRGIVRLSERDILDEEIARRGSAKQSQPDAVSHLIQENP